MKDVHLVNDILRAPPLTRGRFGNDQQKCREAVDKRVKRSKFKAFPCRVPRGEDKQKRGDSTGSLGSLLSSCLWDG